MNLPKTVDHTLGLFILWRRSNWKKGAGHLHVRIEQNVWNFSSLKFKYLVVCLCNSHMAGELGAHRALSANVLCIFFYPTSVLVYK